MPRNYKRKTKPKYSLEDLKKAIDDVKTKKLSMGRAAETYNVPKTTIFDHLNKSVIKQPRSGRKPLFTDEQETQLVDYIINCSKLYYGLTIKKIRQIAYQYAEKNKRIYPLRPIEFDSIQLYAYSHVDITAVAEVHSVENLDVQASDTGDVNSQKDDTSTHAVSLSEIVELPIIPQKISKCKNRKKRSTILTSTPIKDQLVEKENRKRAKAEEIKKKPEKMPGKGSQIKRLKCSDKKPLNKDTRRVLKNFKNLKEFSDPSQNTKEKEGEKEKDDKENEDYFCIYCEEKYIDPPVEDWIMCYMCKKWAHENCTDGQSTSLGYKCDHCRY